MKLYQWVIYGAFVLLGELFVLKEYDRMKHATPPEKFMGSLPPETVFLVPIILAFIIYFLLNMKKSAPLATDLETPVGLLFVGNPSSNMELGDYNPLFDTESDKYLFLINADRSFKQRSNGERIISSFRFTPQEKKKFDSTIFFPFLRDGHLSHEELANYLLDEGGVELQGYNYRISLSEYPQLIHTGEIRIVGMRGLPKTIEDLTVSLYNTGYGSQANELLEAANPPQYKGLRR